MTRHAYIDGDPTNPGHIYFEQDGARLRCELEPEDVIAALDAWDARGPIVSNAPSTMPPIEPNTVYDSSAEHWSPWLEWRGGPCPLPPGTRAQIERPDDGVFDVADVAALAGWDWAVGWKRIIRFRYRADNPAGWLPRGDWIPPAELWDEGCPVRCEWHSEDEDGALSIQRGIPGVWHNITHIRLVARQPQAGLPEGWKLGNGNLYSPRGRLVICRDEAELYGPAAIRQAVDAWLLGDGR